MLKNMVRQYRFLSLLLFLPLLLVGCQNDAPVQDATGQCVRGAQLRVAVFDGHGGSEACVWEALEALRRDSGIVARYITTAQIATGELAQIDVLVVPGGGGSRQWLNLGQENHAKIREFVERGGGFVGICAGAYLASSTPDYACLHLNGAKAIDIEHDNRGHGVAKVTLNERGKGLFPDLAGRDTLHIMYYEGPVYDTVQPYEWEWFATMESDVHTEGNAPANMTNGRPFIIGTELDNGRVMSVVGHPEATPGLQWMIAAMSRWSAKREIIGYEANQRVELFTRENLFTKPMLSYESALYDTLLYASPASKVEAIEWLSAQGAWSGKRWVQGLLFDSAPEVRLAAARYVAEWGYTRYLADLKAAAEGEKDPAIQAKLREYAGALEAQLAPQHRDKPINRPGR